MFSPPIFAPVQTGSDSHGSILAHTFALGLALLVFSLLRGPLIFWNLHGHTISPAGTYVGAAALFFLFAALLLGRILKVPLQDPSAAFVIFLLGLISGSDWLCIRFNLFQGPSIRGELLLTLLLLIPVLRSGQAESLLTGFCCIFPFLLFSIFLGEGSGRFIFSDDHTAVFYRLGLLLENFPSIPFYNPQWNAGMDARDFFATGILNFYFTFYPLLKLFGLTNGYQLCVGVLVFLLVPLFSFFGGRGCGLSKVESALCSAFSLASSLLWYRWCLKYGAMGFVFSAALVPLNLAYAIRVIRGEELHALSWVIFWLSLSLMCLWSLSGIIFLPLLAYAVLLRREIFRSIRIWIFMALFLACHLPWILVFLKSSQVLEFVATKAPTAAGMSVPDADDSEDAVTAPAEKIHSEAAIKGKKKPITPSAITKALRNFATSANPVLLVLAIPGLMTISCRRTRWMFGLVLGWLLMLGAVLAPRFPQLELERMLVLCGLTLSIPAARYLGVLLARSRESCWSQIFCAAIPLSFCLLGPATAASVVRNRSLEKYSWADGTVGAMVEAIQTFGGSGRVVFSGFVLHELSQGHLAPLAYFTKRALVASSPFHNRWRYTDVLPQSFLEKGEQGTEEFLSLMNASAVFAHEPKWREYFLSRKDIYEKVWSGGKFQLFVRKVEGSSFFLHGQGRLIEESSHHLKLVVQSREVVIKWNYFPFLRSIHSLDETSCQLSPYRAAPEIQLIQISNCPEGTEIIIEACDAFERLRS